MLKRQGVQFRPLPKRRCPERRQGSRGAVEGGRLAASVTAWLAAIRSGSEDARETAALEHFALAGYSSHRTCQVCQEAIRARLQRRSLQARQSAPEESAPEESAPEESHADTSGSTPAFAPADSSVWSPRSPAAIIAAPASVTSSDATVPGGAAPRTSTSSENLPTTAATTTAAVYWSDLPDGYEQWCTYWDARSDISSSTTSHDSGRIPASFWR